VAIARARVEQGVTREEGGLVAMGAQANMAHGVARCIHALELDSLAHLDHVACLKAPVHSRDPGACPVVSKHLGPGGCHHRLIAACMVLVLVRIQDLRDLPALGLGCGQALAVIQWIDRQGLTRVRARDQVVEVAVGIAGPDSLYDHLAFSMQRLSGTSAL
jgi:hypothetical protein